MQVTSVDKRNECVHARFYLVSAGLFQDETGKKNNNNKKHHLAWSGFRAAIGTRIPPLNITKQFSWSAKTEKRAGPSLQRIDLYPSFDAVNCARWASYFMFPLRRLKSRSCGSGINHNTEWRRVTLVSRLFSPMKLFRVVWQKGKSWGHKLVNDATVSVPSADLARWLHPKESRPKAQSTALHRSAS